MDELEQQTREVLAGKPVTQDIFPFQVGALLTSVWSEQRIFTECVCLTKAASFFANLRIVSLDSPWSACLMCGQ